VDENLSLALGARFDYFKHAGDSEQTFNPRLAAIYKLRPETTLKAMAGSAFRAPNVYEKYYTAAEYLINPNLDPERIWTYELAADHYWTKDLRTVASVYYYSIEDLITLTDVGGGLYQFVNADKVKAHGLELEAEKAWPGGTRLRGSYTFQLATDEDTGGRLTNSPKHLLKLNLSTPLWNVWQLGLESSFTSQRHTVAGGDVSGETLSNLVLSTNKLVKGMDFSIGLYNLFDSDGFDPASEEHQDSSGLQLNGIPLSSRSWRLKLGYSF
jgi:iron complex outermembrane receptor protein